ncbi:eukaryotic translation initiation factor 4E-binding protein Mextli isoform X2 [Centruroides vittatus]|uniref:eukaryotic translation initiation factor 4E-binding protein Mextli isoform X2 n=1 Tax=Centruroides vittatus TaxID=120091 RepID=UPI00350FD953
MATKAIRHVKKLEKPRPLKQQLILENSTKHSITVDEVIQELESLYITITNGNFDKSAVMSIIKVCNQLKLKGQEIETLYKEQLDRYFVTLRNASRDERIDILCRMRLLEVIELRAMHWKINENVTNYYKQKLQELEASEQTTGTLNNSLSVSYFPGQLTTVSSQTNIGSLLPGEIIKPSGKFAKPTKIPGKNYYKDEIMIRNSDSGKVSPGARDRLVQITGQSEDSINCSKILIEDTIRRNASPIREKCQNEDDCSGSSTSLNSTVSEDSGGPVSILGGKKSLIHSYSMSDATLGEYTFTVTVGHDVIKISGCKVDLVKTAKLVLEEYFAGQEELLQRQKNQQLMAQACLDLTNSNYKTDQVHSEITKQDAQKSENRGSSNLVSSSSDDETYKAEGSPLEDEVFNGKMISELPKDFSNQNLLSKELSKTNNSFIDLKSYLLGQMPEAQSGKQFNQKLSQIPSSEKRETSSPLQKMEFVYNTKEKILYTRDFLLNCAKSPFSQIPPNNLDEIAKIAPIARDSPLNFDPNLYKRQGLSVMNLQTSRQNSVEKTE